MLDVGCGWGTFALHAARSYGVEVVGITLSREQADYASKRMIEEGTRDLVDIRVQDYRDIDDGPFDAISSIGMAEHVGAAMLPTYAAHLYGLLPAQGRLLNHAISRQTGEPAAFSKTSFIDRYVFPDGELIPMATMIDALEGAGFEVRDVESLREHYARTLRAWVANLENNWDEATKFSSAGRRGYGGSTWLARRWGSPPTGSGSIRFWRSRAMSTGTAESPPPAPIYYGRGHRSCEQPAADNAFGGRLRNHDPLTAGISAANVRRLSHNTIHRDRSRRTGMDVHRLSHMLCTASASRSASTSSSRWTVQAGSPASPRHRASS